MDVFSLEDDDGDNLFITQESRSDRINDQVQPILGNSTDFQSPCVSLTSQISNTSAVYEDISDDDAFEIPSSQQQNLANQ